MSEEQSNDQDKLINQIKQRLDQDADALDAATLSRLRQARAQAIEAGERKGFHWFGLNTVGAGITAFASVSVLAVAVWLAMPAATTSSDMMASTVEQEQVFDDLELLAATEDLEFYEEELEFYYWLEAQDAQG